MTHLGSQYVIIDIVYMVQHNHMIKQTNNIPKKWHL